MPNPQGEPDDTQAVPQTSAPPPARRPSPFAQFDTSVIERMRNELRSHIPGDPTFIAHVGTLLRSLLDHELAARRADAAEQPPTDEDRRRQELVELQAKHAEERAAEQKDADEAEAQRKAEEDALAAEPPPAPPQGQQAAA